MPIYEFACSGCGSRFERSMSFSAVATAVACPDCGRGNTEKLMSSFFSFSRGTAMAGQTAVTAPSMGCCGGGCGCGGH
ncbi:MAG: zinc ribbon domain-containing protein [Chloroflexi bacterium]|nr:zinc ribbon domain-containing protein [Chloroflexota bacterium]